MRFELEGGDHSLRFSYKGDFHQKGFESRENYVAWVSGLKVGYIIKVIYTELILICLGREGWPRSELASTTNMRYNSLL